jgi:hypothetical protein
MFSISAATPASARGCYPLHNGAVARVWPLKALLSALATVQMDSGKSKFFIRVAPDLRDGVTAAVRKADRTTAKRRKELWVFIYGGNSASPQPHGDEPGGVGIRYEVLAWMAPGPM